MAASEKESRASQHTLPGSSRPIPARRVRLIPVPKGNPARPWTEPNPRPPIPPRRLLRTSAAKTRLDLLHLPINESGRSETRLRNLTKSLGATPSELQRPNPHPAASLPKPPTRAAILRVTRPELHLPAAESFAIPSRLHLLSTRFPPSAGSLPPAEPNFRAPSPSFHLAAPEFPATHWRRLPEAPESLSWRPSQLSEPPPAVAPFPTSSSTATSSKAPPPSGHCHSLPGFAWTRGCLIEIFKRHKKPSGLCEAFSCEELPLRPCPTPAAMFF